MSLQQPPSFTSSPSDFAFDDAAYVSVHTRAAEPRVVSLAEFFDDAGPLIGPNERAFLRAAIREDGFAAIFARTFVFLDRWPSQTGRPAVFLP